jgi:hypothetical protein
MSSHLLGRLNDQTFATLSAVRYELVRRIGFLFMSPNWRQFASHGAAERAQRVADLIGKIKIARTTTA